MAPRLVLLGSPQLLDREGRTVAFPSKGFLLIGYLLLMREEYRAPRTAIANFLWEDAAAASAALNLRQLISRLTQRQNELGLTLFHLEAGHIRLDPAGVEIDLLQFQRCIAETQQPDIAALSHLYGGDFLSGLDITGSECRDQIELHRSRLRFLFVDALGALMDPAQTSLSPARLVTIAYRLLDLDPYHERACRTLMRLLHANGQHSLARDAYTRFKLRLKAELDVEPEAATRELAARLFEPVARPRIHEPDVRPVDAPALPPSVAPLPRITMLPPVGGGQDPELGEILRGLVDEMTIELCRQKALAVVAPHTAALIGQSEDPQAFLTRFRVSYVVDCRVERRLGDSVLFVQLYRTEGRELVWAEQFRFDRQTIVGHYHALASRIVPSLVAGVQNFEIASSKTRAHPGAYVHCVLGLRQLTLDLPSVRRARKAFRAALEEVPDFALAVSGLARSYQLEWLLLARRDPTLLEESIRLAQRAVALDPDDARGHRELGVARLYAQRFDDSLADLALAERANAQYADLLVDHGDALTHAGDPALGLRKLEHAIELNPLPPDAYWWVAGGAQYLLGRYQDAVESVRSMRNPAAANRLLAASLAMLGEKAEARRVVRLVKEEHPDFRIANWLAMVPFRDPQGRQHYEDGLRAAGFQ
ncbi:BTAD domain-containing putative transcriptional regulator [Labrys wisconsinensis]|uniref:DNA-binding SARP family transcriptional activator/TolB-like protein n=1 Tax=Labrys wisconsinensis TaxID=425677 RepID=A0ABU0JGU5_9HYPH|nr:BTAD domain-containing putative transcriptional regulator [Labrys wisconsinensis]MDQ0473512.1 DNA-binding SARP family transcriptional activator/TolB-like protein [Labrys wisconsinensis]